MPCLSATQFGTSGITNRGRQNALYYQGRRIFGAGRQNLNANTASAGRRQNLDADFAPGRAQILDTGFVPARRQNLEVGRNYAGRHHVSAGQRIPDVRINGDGLRHSMPWCRQEKVYLIGKQVDVEMDPPMLIMKNKT